MPISLEDSDLRPTEVQEMLSDPPGYLLYSGPAILLIFSLLMLGSASFIKYSDIVSGEIILEPYLAFPKVTFQKSGQIRSIYKRDSEKVQKGEIIVEMKHDVSLEGIKYLRKFIDKVDVLLNKSATIIP